MSLEVYHPLQFSGRVCAGYIGTELQALKVKMALSCHADYRWICGTPIPLQKPEQQWLSSNPVTTFKEKKKKKKKKKPG